MPPPNVKNKFIKIFLKRPWPPTHQPTFLDNVFKYALFFWRYFGTVCIIWMVGSTRLYFLDTLKEDKNIYFIKTWSQSLLNMIINIWSQSLTFNSLDPVLLQTPGTVSDQDRVHDSAWHWVLPPEAAARIFLGEQISDVRSKFYGYCLLFDIE